MSMNNNNKSTLTSLFYVTESAHDVLLPLYFLTYMNFMLNKIDSTAFSICSCLCGSHSSSTARISVWGITSIFFTVLVSLAIYCEVNLIPTINSNASSTLGATIIQFKEVKGGSPNFVSSLSILIIIICALWSVIAPILLAICFLSELKWFQRWFIVIGAIVCFVGNILQSPLIVYSISALCELFYFMTIAYTVNKILDVQLLQRQRTDIHENLL